MKKLLWVFVVLVILIGGAVAVLPSLVPMEKIKQEVATAVKDKTGRDLTITGDVELMFWPNIGVRLSDVAFGNAAWAKEKHMVSLQSLEAELAVMPLLSKQVEIKRFVLKQPVINLETNAAGKGNWDIPVQGTTQKSETTQTAEAGSATPLDITFGDIRLEDGRVTYRDGKTGKTETVSDVDVVLSLPDMNSAFDLQGGLTYKEKRVDIGVNLEQLKPVLDGKTTNGALSVGTSGLSLNYKGQIATSGTMLNGHMKADIVSLSDLLAWLAPQPPAAPLPFEKVAFNSQGKISADKISLSDASLTLDDLNAKGDVGIVLSGVRPAITAKLAINKINLDRFISGAEAADKPAATKPKTTEPAKGWSTAPIDLSGLKAVDADVVLDTKGFSVQGVDVGASVLKVVLKNGALAFSSSPASLFDGTFSSDLKLDAQGTMAFDFMMDGVQAKPVLVNFADFKNLSGAADAKVSVTSKGTSQKALIEGLNGTGSVVFRDGAIEGIDLVNIAKMVQRKLGDMAVGEGKTEFVELGGTFTITNGVVSNQDLALKGPLVQASGKGTANLPAKMVDYRVTPILTASSAVEGAKGIGIPVMLKGPFDNIKIIPDFGSVVKQAVENPEQIKENLKSLKGNVKEQGKALEDAFKEDPAKALQGLFGGGVAPAPKQEAAPAPTPEAAPVEPVEGAPAE